MRARWSVTVFAPMVAAAFATACVVNEPESPPRGVVVSSPPPAPVQEERPAPPNPQAVWVAGYWHWTGMQYAWIPGHWDAPPPGAIWAAPTVTMRDGRYIYESGGWQSAPRTRNALR
jgi:YXWGXW repeat-containing protein